MKNTSILNALLLGAGLIGVALGCGMLLAPSEFHATAGIILGSDVNLLNEMRANGGAALGAGAVILLGAFVSRLRFTATIMAATLYMSYGLSRIVSVLIDGAPGGVLQVVAALEIGIGLVFTLALLTLRRSKSGDSLA